MGADKPGRELVKTSPGAGVELANVAHGDALKLSFGTVGEAVTVALGPLCGLVWTGELIEAYVVQTVGRILMERGVPADRIGTPAPDIAVPAIQALTYSKLRENYAKLLATAMDSSTADLAHPGFVEVLKQLTADEARILEYLPCVGLDEPLVDLARDTQGGMFIEHRRVGTIGRDAGCSHPEFVPEYLDNLCRLGLVEIPESHLYDDWRYDRIRSLALVQSGELVIVKKMVGVTSYGGAFRRACLAEQEADTKPANPGV